MDTILKSIGSLCMVTYVMGLLLNMVNVTHTQKAIRLTFAMYIIISVFIPLKNADIKFDLHQYVDQPLYYAESEEYIFSQAEETLENNIKLLLEEKNISYIDVDVHINKQDEFVSIDEIILYGISSDRKAYVNKIINSEGKIIFGD